MGQVHILPPRVAVSDPGERACLAALAASHRALSRPARSAPGRNRSAKPSRFFIALSHSTAEKLVLGWAPPVNSKSVRARLNSLPVSAPGSKAMVFS